MGIFGRDETNPDQPSVGAAASPSPTPAPRDLADRTIIAPQSKFDGLISGSGEIIVNGLVTGKIDASGTVKVANQGRVEATVHGKTVTVAGTVTGDITADERIELEPTSRVDGNITAPRILIQDGATFRGQVNMKEPATRPEVRTSSARKTPGESPAE